MITDIVRAGGALLRRCPVPDDPGAVTVVGDEVATEATDRIWERVEALYRTGVHPGIQVCLRHRGEVVVHRSIGHARGVAPGRPPDDDALLMSPDTPVNLFSAAKAVTSMLMHKVAESGAFDLDDPVAAHVPDFGRHGKERITIRQVLTHRAGIPSWPAHAFDLDLLSDPEQVVRIVCELVPSGAAGTGPAYHAVTGGFVMDVVARHATGRSVRDLLASEVKTPLGLAWFDYGVPDDHVDRIALNVLTGVPLTPLLSRHVRRLLGCSWDEVIDLSNDPRFVTGVIPSANVFATAADVAIFYQCLLDGGVLDGVRVFEPETVHRAVGDDVPGNVSLDRMIGLPFRYGTAGFMHGTDGLSLYGWNHPRAFGHVGMSNSFTWADPDRDLVVVLLTTGKPIMGTHLVALPQLISEIHHCFPAD